jgi:hypothetical protein
MPARASIFRLEVFLVSLAGLLLEISYTRIFSFKVSSYFTYLLIGFALLGIGSGGVLMAIAKGWRRRSGEEVLPPLSFVTSLVVVLGYLVVARTELSTFAPPASLGQVTNLAVVCLAVFAAFAGVGLIVAWIFARQSVAIAQLYFADLVGASLGCVLAIPLMIRLTPPGCVLAAAAVLAASGLRLARAGGWRVALATTSALLAVGARVPGALPALQVDPAKTLAPANMAREHHRVLDTVWHPVFRVDVFENPAHPEFKGLAHDGQWGSGLWQFDGDTRSLPARFAASNRRLAFGVAPPRPRVLVIGSAGGQEILASLAFEAAHVTAVELNPATVALLRGRYRTFTGDLAGNPDVTLVNAEGRSFLERDRSSYDLIYFVAPDSYAAMNAAQASGFVLAESYLYTVEMIRAALAHLAPGGVLAMQFGEFDYAGRPNRTARYAVTARAALAELGVSDFPRHVLIATNTDYFTLSTLLVSPTPFSPTQIEAFRHDVAAIPSGVVRHAPGLDPDGAADPTLRVITAPAAELDRLLARHAYDLRPVRDDKPFFWHFVRFGDLLRGRAPEGSPFDPEDGRGEQALLVMLLVATVFASVFLLLPLIALRTEWARLPRKGLALLYFASLGLAFMGVEIVLIQKWSLILGYPTYALTVTLCAILFFSGLGSLATTRYADRSAAGLPWLAAGLTVCTLGHGVVLGWVAGPLLAQPFGVRIATAVAAMAPLGFCLGAFMPLGLAAVARLEREASVRVDGDGGSAYVAWAWAVNGFFSVIGSLLATMASMTWGFQAVLAGALAIYLGACLVLRALVLSVSGDPV